MLRYDIIYNVSLTTTHYFVLFSWYIFIKLTLKVKTQIL